MDVKESYYPLLTHILAVIKQAANSHNFRNKSLIYFLLLFTLIVLVFAAFIPVFEIADEHSIHISAKERRSVVTKDDSIRIDHRYDLKDELLSQCLRFMVPR
jgi:hypothetical protein